MTKIEVIKLFDDADIYSILAIGYDSIHIYQSARLAFSEKSVNKYIQKKQRIAEKTGKTIAVRWHGQNN